MEKKFAPRVWIDKRRIDEANLSSYGGCGIATLWKQVKSDIIYLSLEEHQALIAPLIEALGKIKDTESKCLLGPRIDEGDRMVERASSSDDLMCWSHELGSHKAYVECSILANNALENYKKQMEEPEMGQ